MAVMKPKKTKPWFSLSDFYAVMWWSFGKEAAPSSGMLFERAIPPGSPFRRRLHRSLCMCMSKLPGGLKVIGTRREREIGPYGRWRWREALNGISSRYSIPMCPSDAFTWNFSSYFWWKPCFESGAAENYVRFSI